MLAWHFSFRSWVRLILSSFDFLTSCLLTSSLMSRMVLSILRILSRMATQTGGTLVVIGLAIKRILQLEVEDSKQIQGYLNIIIIQMAHSTELFKYTVIESPIKVSTEGLLRSLQGKPHRQLSQRIDVFGVRRRLQMDSKRQEDKQQAFLQDRQHLQKQGGKIRNGEGQAAQNGTKLLKSEKFNSILQQIGQFKKSIYQIRERLQKNIMDAKPQPIYLTQKKHPQNHKYQHLQQNYSYTNYRDLSNRGKSNRSYDRWKSHERSYTFLKDPTPIQQFTIEIPDSK